MAFMLALRIARRDLRGSARAFRLLIAGIALGTAAVAAVGLLSAAILGGMRDNARMTVGGDISLRLFHQPPAPAQLAAFAAAGQASLTAELRPLAHRGARSALVELKAIDDGYPLYGALVLKPAAGPAEAFGQRDGVWGAAVAPALLEALGAVLGDIVTVGGRRFELRATIEDEPDRAMRAFSLGPRMIVGLAAVAGTELVAPGAQVYWYSRIRLAPGQDAGQDAAAAIAAIERGFPDAGFRIVAAADGVPGVERSVAFVSSLLGLSAMGMLLIGGIGVGSAVSAYLDRKRGTIASLRALGAPASLILRVYLVQVMAAAALGVGFGVASGVVAAHAALALLGAQLGDGLALRGGIAAGPLVLAGGAGLLVALLFALRPLGQAAGRRPQALFRSVAAPEAGGLGAGMRVAIGVVAALLALLLVWSAPLPVVAAVFGVAAAGVALAFLGLGRAVAWAARRLGRMRGLRHGLLRLALGNLHRPGAPTAAMAMAVGLSVTLLVTVAVVRANAERHLAATLPATAPDLVVLNIAPADDTGFDRALAGMPGVVRWQRAPFLHARVSHIAGQRVAERRIPAAAGFVIRGDRGVSWQAAAPEAGVVAGAWWAAGYQGPPLASLDEAVAGRLGVAVGDSITLILPGGPLEARIANLRRVDWTGLGLDFPILLSPPRDLPPHREVAAVWLAPGTAGDTRAALARLFPESPSIAVDEVIEVLAGAVAMAGALLAAAVAATGVAALVVLGGAVAATRGRRLREAVVLKVLGATRRQVLVATMLEFALLGGVVAGVSVALGTLAAWAVVERFVAFRPALGASLPWAAMALAVMAAAGMVGAIRALGPPAAWVLRRGE